jgi:hypothetical protein
MRLKLVLVFSSLGLAALLLLSAIRIVPKEEGGRDYAVLVFDASYSDRLIGERLMQSALGSSYISASTQSVFLNNFEELQQVPLDEYQARIESFDPRNDGYAEKLESFFVRDGKRFFFVPLPQKQEIASTFTEFLEDIPFTIEYLGNRPISRPISFYAMLFGVAAVLGLFLSTSFLVTLVLLPLLASLALTGSAGFVLAGALLAMANIVIDPLEELFVSWRYGNARIGELLKERTHFNILYRKFPLKTTLFCLFLALYIFVGITNRSFILLAIEVLVCFLGILLFAVWIKSKQQGQDHVRFMPVPIITVIGRRLISRSIIPFGIAALLAVFLPSHLLSELPDVQESNAYNDMGTFNDPRYLIDESEYEEHIAFQSNFSLTPIFSSDGKADEGIEGYMRYYLGDDGLIAGTKAYDANNKNVDSTQFPLKNLMDFLGNSDHTYKNEISTQEVFSACIILLLGLLSLFNIGRKRGKDKMLEHNEKRNLFRRRMAA